MPKAKKNETVADECPKCGYLSYQGGYCFGCGIYRPSKRTRTIDRENLDTADFINKSFGTQMTALEPTEEDWDEFLLDKKMRWKHGKKKPGHKSVVYISEQNLSEVALVVQGVVQPYSSTSEGQLVRAFVLP
jgi:ribosomal protein L37E